MSDRQTTALIILVFTAFLFWLYNSKTAGGRSRLAVISDAITGKADTATALNTALSPVPVNAGIAPVNYNDANGTGQFIQNAFQTVATQNGYLLDFTPVGGNGPQPSDFWNPLGVG